MKYLISKDEALALLHASGAAAPTMERFESHFDAVMKRKFTLSSVDGLVEVSSVAGKRTGEPAVDVDMHALVDGGVMISHQNVRIQIDVKSARKIAMDILTACEAAITDITLLKLLTSKLGLDLRAAAAMLIDLRELRQGTRGGVVEH